jgi:polyvinyl alcohol dehydrogenase (cytochrome)
MIGLRVLLFTAFAALCSYAQEGTRVFISKCQQCHSPNSDSHAPSVQALATMPWQDIVKALETGPMKAQGSSLTPDERRAVARYLGSVDTIEAPKITNQCPANAKPAPGKAEWNGWSSDDNNARFQAATAAGFTASQLSSLKVKWAFGFPNGAAAYGQPTVYGGRIYNGSNDGTIYALDAHTGCVYWTFSAAALVRAPILIGPGPHAYFGDLQSNFYALDANTGRLLWKKKLDDQAFTRITAAAKIYDGRLYVPIASQEENAGADPKYACCTFRGNLMALDAKDGTVLWKTYTTPEAKPTHKSATGVQFYGPSGATIWSSPTVDAKRGLVYAATGNGYSDPPVKTADAIVAFDMKTGAIRWTQQASLDMFNWSCGPRAAPGGNCPENHGPDVDFGSPAILADAGNGKQMIVAGQKSGVVHGLDPDKEGAIVWQTRIGHGSPLGGIEWGMAVHDGLVFAPLSDINRDDPQSAGGMFALDVKTGKVVWHTPSPKLTCLAQRGCNAALIAPPTVIAGAVFVGSMDGHLRAYAEKTGEVIWDNDTAHTFDTVDGVPAHGGSFGATGPTIVDGMLYVNSGYSAGLPGNVMLAFSAGK